MLTSDFTDGFIDVSEIKVIQEKPVILFLTVEELDQLYAYDFSRIPRLEKLGICLSFNAQQV